MVNLYKNVRLLTGQLDELHSHMTKLNEQWIKAKGEPFQLVDYLYTMAEYVDNEFYKTLKNVKGKPHQISVLHLHSYDENLKSTVDSKWESIQILLDDIDGKCLINSYAYSIVSEVLPAFEYESKSPDKADEAYNATRGLIEQFISEMLGSRSFLKVSV